LNGTDNDHGTADDAFSRAINRSPITGARLPRHHRLATSAETAKTRMELLWRPVVATGGNQRAISGKSENKRNPL
jgi:hypothetical protein